MGKGEWRQPWRAASKRTLDVVCSGTVLIVALPLFAAIAVAIKLDSRGPVFYRCRRIGRFGREFAMLKFRKMADGSTGPPLTTAGDTRFTRVGRWLSRSKLDELPQLWNVLRGDMSLVGPRPEDGAFTKLWSDERPEILQLRPGITGLSQLAFARESDLLDPDDRVNDYVSRIMPLKLALDSLYARRWSVRMDLRVLAWTAVAVFLRDDVAVDRRTGDLGFRRRPSPTRPDARRHADVELRKAGQ